MGESKAFNRYKVWIYYVKLSCEFFKGRLKNGLGFCLWNVLEKHLHE